MRRLEKLKTASLCALMVFAVNLSSAFGQGLTVHFITNQCA
jgi:hypothetical protein